MTINKLLYTGIIADNLPAGATSAVGSTTSATQYTTLSALGINTLLCEYDFAVASSWSGSGQYVFSLVDSPVDGSPVSSWTLFLGSSTAVESNDPVFKGSAGTIGCYVCTLPSDLFMVCGTAAFSSTIRTLGSITSNPDWWVAVAMSFRPIIGLANSYLVGNAVTGRQGFSLQIAPGSVNSEKTSGVNFSLCKGSTTRTFSSPFQVTVRTSTGIGDNTPKDVIMVFSYRASDKAFIARRWVSGVPEVSGCVDAIVSSTNQGSPIRSFHVFETPGGGGLSSSSRAYAFAMGNSFITTAEMSVLYKEWGRRRQVTYDPNV